MLLTTLAASLLSASALACADHNYHRQMKRAENSTGMAWSYEASYDWGRLSEDYVLCQDGTQQAPIPLRLDQGLSLSHILHFDRYNFNQSGVFRNWGYGPAMTFSHPEGNYTSLPSFTFEDSGVNETVYMTGWHIHAPGDHTVQGARSKAEMHFVHVNTKGAPRAVLAFRIDPGNADSTFFTNLPPMISYRDINKTIDSQINPQIAINEVARFNEFWTYRGEYFCKSFGQC
jgi:carbonic anhydrase